MMVMVFFEKEVMMVAPKLGEKYGIPWYLKI